MDNNRPLHIARRSSIIESIFENRLSIIGSTGDVQGSIIVHDGVPYQTVVSQPAVYFARAEITKKRRRNIPSGQIRQVFGLLLHLRPNYIHSTSNDIHTDGPRATARARG